MFPITDDLQERISRWGDLKRWERRELGQDLRRLGMSYGEIAALIPVAKGTLSNWCRDLELTKEEQARISATRPRTDAQRRNGQRRHREALERRERIRRDAELEAQRYLADSAWTAGVVAYWSEGAKRSGGMRFSNSDPDLVRLFIGWIEAYMGITTDLLTAKLHLHSGQDERERKAFWSAQTKIPLAQFGKTYIKPEGTGHRKNKLYNGTLTVAVRRSGALLHRLQGWIDALRDSFPR